MPEVSVVLPVYNGLSYLEEAIKSILSQTYSDFELIIIDDGSTDDSASIVETFDDSRIRFFRQQNRGLATTLNRAISHAKGKYIARQDQDDVSFATRLQKQVAFLDGNPTAGVVGTYAEIWVDKKRTNRLLAHPADDAALRFNLLFDNYFVHSSVMIRKSVLDETGGYTEDKSRQPPEDYELWSRMMRSYKVANVPEVLMIYREVQGSMSRKETSPFMHNVVKISTENIAWATDSTVDSPEVLAIAKLLHGDYEGMPQGIRFCAMSSVLNKAVLKIAQESGESPQQLMPIAQEKLNRLRYHYADYCSGGLIGKVLNSHVGNHAKLMIKRFLKKVVH